MKGDGVGKAVRGVGGRRRSRALTGPPDLVAARMHLGKSEFLILSFPVTPVDRFAALTAAERQVAELILEGLTNRQIACRRRSAERTVANQVAAILKKLGVGSRYELVARFAVG